MSTNLEYRGRERQRKRESRRQANWKKSDRELEREIKNKGDIFCWENNIENFVAAMRK